MRNTSEFFDVSWVNGIAAIELHDSTSFEGRLMRLADDLIAFQEANQPTKVVIDFSILNTMMGTPMIIDLVRFKREADAAGCDVCLSGLNQNVRALYELGSLKSSFPMIFASKAEAISALSSSET